MSSFWDLSVGVVSVLATSYCLVLLCVHFMRRKSAKVSKIVLTLSYTSLVCMSVAPASICLTYFQPRMGSLELSDCYCAELWSISLVGYVISLYALKASYLAQTRIPNGTALLTDKTRTAVGVNIVSVSMCATVIVCLFMVTFRSSGTCHSDAQAKGCLPTFDLSVLYVALTMISMDCMLFAWFFYRVNNSVQFSATAVALASCVSDSVFHVICYKSDGSGYTHCMTVYCLDTMVIATCTSLCCRFLNDQDSVASKTPWKQPPIMRLPLVTVSRQAEETPTDTETSAPRGTATCVSLSDIQNSYSSVRISMPPAPVNHATCEAVVEGLHVKQTDAELLAMSMAFSGLVSG